MLKNIITAAVVALVTSLLAFALFSTITPDAPVEKAPLASEESFTAGAIQGTVMESPYIFKNGSGDGGNNLTFTVDGTINAGANQASWRNTTGRIVWIDQAQTGFTSGTASSSMDVYVATSTSATIADNFARPAGEYLIIDGAGFATSTTGNRSFTSTTTPDGYSSSFPVASGEYVVFQYQERYGCTLTGGLCETATSTNRGISSFFWYLRGHYKP